MAELYTQYPTLQDAEAAERRMFASYGYTPRIQAENKTTRLVDIIPHPTDSSKGFLIGLSEAHHHGLGRRQNLQTRLNAGETSRIRTKAEWKLEGWFPPSEMEILFGGQP